MLTGNPKLVLVFSGKRKSGKDYLTDELVKLLPNDSAVILRLSGPLKKAYAEENQLDYSRLLDTSEYKEKYRADMVKWGEKKRDLDPGFFCRLAIKEYKASEYPIWIVSDARRKTDIAFFQTVYRDMTKLCRVTATEEARKTRGWQFVEGIDDAETECGLDQFSGWNIEMDNSGVQPATDLLKSCVALANEALKM